MPRGWGRLTGALAVAATTAANGVIVDSAAVSLRRPPRQPPGAAGASAHAGRPLLLRLAARNAALAWKPGGTSRKSGRGSTDEHGGSGDGAAAAAAAHTEDDEAKGNAPIDEWPEHHQRAYKEAENRPVFFSMVCGWIALMGLGAMQSVVASRQYHHAGKHIRAQGEEPEWSFVGYIRYRFGWWFTWQKSAYAFVVCQILLAFVFLFASLYCFYEGVNAKTSMYKVLIWLMCPDGGVSEKTTHGHIIGALVSLGGLILLALAISAVHAGFSNYIDLIRMGFAPVVEAEHIVILGYTSETIALVEELCAAFRDKGGTKIAILADGEEKGVTPASMGKLLHHPTYHSRIFVRFGSSVDVQALQHVSLPAAALVIVMPNTRVDEEQRDALTLQTLFFLRRQGWPLQGRVLVACSIVRNAQLMKQAGTSCTSLVMLNSFVAKLMSHCSRDHGLGMAINELIGFHGNAFFTEMVPEHLVGLPFSEAFAYYSDAVVVGMISPSTSIEESEEDQDSSFLDRRDSRASESELVLRIRRGASSEWALGSLGDDSVGACLCPGDLQMQVGAELLLVARQRLGAYASPELAPGARSRQMATVSALSEPSPGQTMIILGWNEWTATLLFELDRIVPPHSQAIIFDKEEIGSRNESMCRAERNWKRRLQNIEVKNVVGQLGSYWQLEETLVAPLEDGKKPPLEQATLVFVLAAQDATPEKADAYAVTTILHTRDIMQKRGLSTRDVSFVPQISGSVAHPVCKGAGISDYVSPSDLMAKVLALHAVDARVGQVLEYAISGTHADIAIRRLEDYLGAQAVLESVSFFDAARLASSCEEVLLGWTEKHGRFVLNPLDKGSPRPWSRGDRLMVLHRQRRIAPAGLPTADDHG